MSFIPDLTMLLRLEAGRGKTRLMESFAKSDLAFLLRWVMRWTLPLQISVAMRQTKHALLVNEEERPMAKVRVIAIDLAENVFQVCGMAGNQKIEFDKTLRRSELAAFMVQQPATVVATEACYSNHYWGRTLESMRRAVKLLPAQFVKPFVHGHKSDRSDVVAIAEAYQRPNIVPEHVKTVEQQDVQILNRMRDRYAARRTSLVNQGRGLLSEYGIVAPQGIQAFCQLLREVAAPGSNHLSDFFRPEFVQLMDEYCWLTDRIDDLNAKLTRLAKENEASRISLSIPGIGAIDATALCSAIGRG